MIRIKTPTLRNTPRLFTVLLVTIILSSCASLSHIDNAQDEFNKGAEIENAALLNQSISLVTPPQPSDYYYKRAYAEVNQALQKDANLKKLEVYVNALSIKALCEWKLGKYGEAKKSAKVAKDYMQAQNITADDIPRDYAVMHALSALIGIEEMNDMQATFFKASDNTSEAAKAEYNKFIYKEGNVTGNIQKDLEDLKSISDQISKKHDVQTYLIMSQLAALKVWSDALNSSWRIMIKNSDLEGENQDWIDDEKAALKDAKETAAGLLETQLKSVGGKSHPVYLHWAYLLNLPTQDED